MSLKYAVALGEEVVPGIDDITRWAHVPLDNVVLSAPECLGAPKLAAPWSRLDDYERYYAFQVWFRGTFPDRPPWRRSSSYGTRAGTPAVAVAEFERD